MSHTVLNNKPANQRWAVLVNEFGEIGVDGALIEGHYGEDQGVFIREVPAGCMCCASGFPMQIALNQLLVIAKPDRLLMELTGLGHPKEVLQILSSAAYRTALSVEKIITVVNARQLFDERYTESEIFNQQIEVADIVVGNKSDLYQAKDAETLQTYAQERAGADVQVILTVNGEIEPSLLTGSSCHIDSANNSAVPHQHAEIPTDSTMPDCGYIKKINKGHRYYSVGWQFRKDKTFCRDDLFSFLNSIEAERVKAVMNTESGVLGYNVADVLLTEVKLFGGGRSCIEIIGSAMNGDWEVQLLRCLEEQD